MRQEELAERVRRDRGRLVELASKLVSTPSENPGQGAAALQEFVEEYLEERGIRARRHVGVGGEFALTATLGGRGGDGLILYAHADVVPAGDPAKWLSPPFQAKLVGGRIYGRGACDMKAGLAAELYVFALTARAEAHLSRPLTFASIPDEEYWKRTPAGPGFSNWLLREGLLKGSACIMGEPSGLDKVYVGERGDYWFKLKAEGEAGHGSAPLYERNVFVRLFRALEDVREALREAKGEPPQEVKRMLATSYRLAAKELGLPLRELRSAGILERPTINIGRLCGGTMINTLPDSCEAEVAACVPLGLSWRQLHKLVAQAVSRHPKIKLEVEEDSQTDPSYTRPSERVVAVLRRCAAKTLGRPPTPCLTQATSDANVFRAHGIPTCLYGPGSIGLAHAYNEHVEVEELVKAAEVYARTVAEYCMQST